jgi:hypothetical protein
MLSPQERLFRGIFGRTAQEQAEFIAALRDLPEWAIAHELADKHSAEGHQLGKVTHVVPVLQLNCDEVTPWALAVDIEGLWNDPVEAIHAYGTEYDVPAYNKTNYTPIEGSWQAWRKARLAEARR